ncbi:MAG: cation:proton antiporter [Candidatus Eisenbacteria bacterium]|nr:cation:proton antiporter [Candidatus Eisenbacteria bacterium]
MKPTGMTVIVKTITDFVVGFIVLFGAYIVLYGHITPGGGFSGGVVIACAFILVMLGHGRDVAFERLGERTASILDSTGALAFLVIAWLGVWGGYFFMNVLVKGTPFRLLSSGSILANNLAIGLKVSSSLFLVFSALAVFRKRSFRALLEDDLT